MYYWCQLLYRWLAINYLRCSVEVIIGCFYRVDFLLITLIAMCRPREPRRLGSLGNMVSDERLFFSYSAYSAFATLLFWSLLLSDWTKRICYLCDEYVALVVSLRMHIWLHIRCFDASDDFEILVFWLIGIHPRCISGTRYGASLRKQIKKMEVSQHSKYFCEFCGKVWVGYQ